MFTSFLFILHRLCFSKLKEKNETDNGLWFNGKKKKKKKKSLLLTQAQAHDRI